MLVPTTVQIILSKFNVKLTVLSKEELETLLPNTGGLYIPPINEIMIADTSNPEGTLYHESVHVVQHHMGLFIATPTDSGWTVGLGLDKPITQIVEQLMIEGQYRPDQIPVEAMAHLMPLCPQLWDTIVNQLL